MFIQIWRVDPQIRFLKFEWFQQNSISQSPKTKAIQLEFSTYQIPEVRVFKLEVSTQKKSFKVGVFQPQDSPPKLRVFKLELPCLKNLNLGFFRWRFLPQKNLDWGL